MQVSAILKTFSIAVLAALLVFGAASQGLAQSDRQRERNEFYKELATRGGGAAGAPADAGRSTRVTRLQVTGVIGSGAHRQFRAALSRGNPELVVIDGPGGILGEALLIGEEVRRRRLTTFVAPHRSCVSACAVVFLSGARKYLGAGAAIGLHSASYADGSAAPEATQLMAAYLRQMGVPSSTLRRMARTAPNKIRWLTKAELRAMGIKSYRRRK